MAGAPAPAALHADAAWRCIDFVSDLHLSAAQPRTVDAFAAYLARTRADALLILGDLFEFWPGDGAEALPLERRCLDALAEAAKRRFVGVMLGNRDFLLRPALLQRFGLRALEDPTLLDACGRRLLLTHGDALCLSDTAYQQFRAWVRDSATQAEFLKRPLAERVALGASVRHASEAGRRQAPPPGGWGDIDAAAAVQWLHAASAACMIHGHTHRPGDSVLGGDCERSVLADWDLDGDALRAEVLRLDASGLRRIAPEAAG
jgi:UDP-2,3-diacylglucosamine hydrolase